MDRQIVPDMPRFLRAADWWLCTCAIGVYQLGITVMNSAVFPLYSGVFLEARDIGSIASTLWSLTLYALAATCPSRLRPASMARFSLACALTGSILMVVCALAGNPILLTLATCLRTVGTVWVGCVVSLPLIALTARHGTTSALAALCFGWALCYALEVAVSFIPSTMQYAVFVLGPLVVMALSYRASHNIVDQIRTSSPAADLRVTNPRSFLPLGHTVFVMFILLKASFGFAITFASTDGTPIGTVVACIPALVISCSLLVRARPNHGLNSFYRATMLCVLAGFLLVNPLIGSVTNMPALANVVLRAGSDLTRMFAFLLIAHLGSRNPTNALGLSLYLGAANSLGSVVGAQFGIAANSLLISDPGVFSLLLASATFTLVAVNILMPQRFDFDATAHGIEAVLQPQTSIATDTLGAAVIHVAHERGLTPRESEALDLLAHGRNTKAIQDRMVVSRSTAKTHVRNVYAKLGVHSQQELIDLLEQTNVR